VELKITKLGAQADGVAEGSGEPIFVSGALPGEVIRAEVEGARARLVEVLSASPDRVEAACRHFGTCGGCAIQHLARDRYNEWKRGIVTAAFSARGLDANIGELISVGHGARRRAVFTATRDGREIALGFHAAGSHDVVDLTECAVVDAGIVRLLPSLRTFIAPLVPSKGGARVTVLAATNGFDVAVEVDGMGPNLPAGQRARLAAGAAELNLLRFSINGDPVYQMAAPLVAMGAAHVTPPPGVFLQASAEAEAAMARLIVEALPRRAKRAVDLFSGMGAFSFALAARVKVLAIDSDANAIAALEMGKRHAQGLKTIDTKVRDLMREPLSRKELEGFDLAVFDPPRAGAQAQAEMLAKSAVPVVVAVSCNPATLARDARILIDGGYKLGRVTPVDQFLYSPHVEVVAVFTR
jgi:23S rRNA (uracil1939-C5)-methyltransferase